MATITRYEDIVAWQEGRALVKAVYAVTANFASSKKICAMLHCLIKSIKDIERKK